MALHQIEWVKPGLGPRAKAASLTAGAGATQWSARGDWGSVDCCTPGNQDGSHLYRNATFNHQRPDADMTYCFPHVQNAMGLQKHRSGFVGMLKMVASGLVGLEMMDRPLFSSNMLLAMVLLLD